MTALLEGGLWAKGAVACVLLGLLLHIVAFSAPNWAETDSYSAVRKEHIGLWKYCTYPYGGGQRCDDFIDIITGDWLKAAQSFTTLALFGLMASVAVVCACAFVPDMQGDARMLFLSIGVLLTTTFFMGVGIGVFGGRYSEYFVTKDPAYDESSANLSWAFGLDVAAAGLTCIAMILMIFELIFERDE